MSQRLFLRLGVIFLLSLAACGIQPETINVGAPAGDEEEFPCTDEANEDNDDDHCFGVTTETPPTSEQTTASLEPSSTLAATTTLSTTASEADPGSISTVSSTSTSEPTTTTNATTTTPETTTTNEPINEQRVLLEELVPRPDAVDPAFTLTDDRYRANNRETLPSSECFEEPNFFYVDVEENHMREWQIGTTWGKNEGEVFADHRIEIWAMYADSPAHATEIANWFGPFAERCPSLLHPIPGPGQVLTFDRNGLVGSGWLFNGLVHPETGDVWGYDAVAILAADDVLIQVWVSTSLYSSDEPPSDAQLEAASPTQTVDYFLPLIADRLVEVGIITE